MTILNRLMRTTPIAAVLAGTMGLAIFTLPTAGHAQSTGAVNDQMQQMQRELDVLQKHVYQGRSDEIAQVGPGGGNLGTLQLRIDELESRMRDMNGRIEELNYRVNQLNDRLDKFSSDVDFRLGNNSGSNTAPDASGGGTAAPQSADAPITLRPPSQAPQPSPPAGAGDPNRAPSTSGTLGTLPFGSPQSASVPPAGSQQQGGGNAGMSVRSDQALPEGTPQEQYNYAYALLTQADYPGAERALTAFLAAHPSHALAGNAQYWLGETYYVRNDFNQAARAFAIGFQKYPKNSKGPDNLLKLGLSLGQLSKTKEACQSYNMLKSEFPKAPQEVIRRADAERKRLRCT